MEAVPASTSLTALPDQRGEKGGGKGGGKGPRERNDGGGGGGGDWKAEPDEGWLRDRVNLRKRTPINCWEIFPRSPAPQRKTVNQEATSVPQAQEVTPEEAARAAKFQ